MGDHEPGPGVTALLVDWSNGDQRALEELMPLVYGELRRLAGSHLRRERAEHTLQSTALVHEAFLRLVDQRDVHWRSRAHFYGIAAQMIRRILVDHARSQQAGKRGAGAIKLELNEAMTLVRIKKNLTLLALTTRWSGWRRSMSARAAIVELRFFAGLSVEETAEVIASVAGDRQRGNGAQRAHAGCASRDTQSLTTTDEPMTRFLTP